MECPICKTELKMAERSGVEIDYCPKCRGVWLDRGELDKIIEKSAAEFNDRERNPSFDRPEPQSDYPPRDQYRNKYDDDYYKYKHKRKKSFFEDLFDF